MCLGSQYVYVVICSGSVSLMCLGSHRRAVGFGVSPVQRHVFDVCSGPASLPLELCGSQSPVEPHAGGEPDSWLVDLLLFNDWKIIDSAVSPSGTWTLCRLPSQWSGGRHRNTLRKVSTDHLYIFSRHGLTGISISGYTKTHFEERCWCCRFPHPCEHIQYMWWSNWSICVRWYVLDAETTDLVAIHTDGNEQLSVMRFSVGGWSQLYFLILFDNIMWEVSYKAQNSPVCVSADGSLLAVGSHDNFIYLYTISESGRKYSRYGKCTVSLFVVYFLFIP